MYRAYLFPRHMNIGVRKKWPGGAKQLRNEFKIVYVLNLDILVTVYFDLFRRNIIEITNYQCGSPEDSYIIFFCFCVCVFLCKKYTNAQNELFSYL